MWVSVYNVMLGGSSQVKKYVFIHTVFYFETSYCATTQYFILSIPAWKHRKHHQVQKKVISVLIYNPLLLKRVIKLCNHVISVWKKGCRPLQHQSASMIINNGDDHEWCLCGWWGVAMTMMVKMKTGAHGDDDNGNNSDDDVVVVVDDDGDNSDNDDYANIVQSVVPFTNMFADLSIDK